ncbi:MAG: hypothetical protein Q7R62_01755 [bacterium]|nr:hypothetical protein [bacterium]
MKNQLQKALLEQDVRVEDFTHVASDPELLRALTIFFWATRIPCFRDRVVQELTAISRSHTAWAFENISGG